MNFEFKLINFFAGGLKFNPALVLPDVVFKFLFFD
jgi:hypothetical protein